MRPWKRWSKATGHRDPGQSQNLVPGDSQKPGLVLNYVFIPEGDYLERQPTPLPLTISDVLAEEPSAKLRPLIIEELRSEGIEMALGDVRFWKTREPLHDHDALSNPNTWVQEEGTEGTKFIPITFTQSLSYWLGDWIRDKSLVHLIVTGTAIPFPTRLATGPPPHTAVDTVEPLASQTFTMGTYSVGYGIPGRQIWQDVKNGERHSRDIPIIRPPSTSSHTTEDPPKHIPAIVLGIKKLDSVSHGDEVQILSYVSNVCPEGFRIHLDAFGSTCLYDACLSWMAISPHCAVLPPNIDAVQCGTVDSQFYHPRKLGCRYTAQRVQFQRPYQRPPKVFSCLAGLTIGGTGIKHWDIKAFVTDIDMNGFTLHIGKMLEPERDVNEVYASAQASWVAFPDGGTTSSYFDMGECGLGKPAVVVEGQAFIYHGQLTFTNSFSSPPDVFAALTSLDTFWSGMSLILDVESVTSETIVWKLTAWHNKPIHGARIAFLAIGSR